MMIITFTFHNKKHADFERTPFFTLGRINGWLSFASQGFSAKSDQTDIVE